MKKCISIIVLVFTSLLLKAQGDSNKNSEQSILSALINNNWDGEGMLMGAKATFTMKWEHALQSQFIKLEFQNSRKLEGKEDIVFMATAFYKIENDTVVIGYWFDSRGVSFPLKGNIKDKEMIINWGNPETEMGKTVYRYTADNTITVEDYIGSKGTYHKFGNATYIVKTKQ